MAQFLLLRVVDEVGHVGIGAANPVAGAALTLNGDGSTYEGIMFQVNTDNKFQIFSSRRFSLLLR